MMRVGAQNAVVGGPIHTSRTVEIPRRLRAHSGNSPFVGVVIPRSLDRHRVQSLPSSERAGTAFAQFREGADRDRWLKISGLWVPIIRSCALTRGFALHPGTRNRYEIRYTRTQHRPASRQVNDHGPVSGTHTGSQPHPHRRHRPLPAASTGDLADRTPRSRNTPTGAPRSRRAAVRSDAR